MDRNLRLWPARLALSRPAVWLPLLTLIVGGARLLDVSAWPIHADEAEQAYRLGTLLETGRVPSFVHDLHGPLLAYLAWPFARLGGADSYATLEAWMLRSSVVFTSLFAFTALWLLRRELGRALPWAALLIATAPAVNHYARTFIHETALASVGLLAFALARRLGTGAGFYPALAFGACLGALLATKLTSLLFAPAFLAVLLFRPASVDGTSPKPPPRPLLLGAAALASGTLTLVAVYSSFGRDWDGLAIPLQSLAPMLARGLGEGTAAHAHVKPWSYLLGVLFSEVGFWLWATLMAAWFACRTAPAPCRGLAIGLALFAGVPLLVYSLLPYKTPWLVLAPLTALLVLAAISLEALREIASPARARMLLVLACVGIAAQLGTSLGWFSTIGDEHEKPHAYVATSAELVPALAPLLELAREPGRRIIVVSSDYWPLPWYFREVPAVGYFDSPPAGSARSRDLWIIEASAWPAQAPAGWAVVTALPLRTGRTLLALAKPSP